MKKQFQKDKKIRNHYFQQELNNIVLKSIVRNENIPLLVKWNAVAKLEQFFKNRNKTRFVNRCILTKRQASFNKIFKKFSRLSVLRLARSGLIPGVQKSSW